MSWETELLGNLMFESRIPAVNPNPNKRIRVKLNVAGVEKRPLENEIEGATKQFIRKSGQFIYGKQNFHKGAFGIIPPELDGYETSADIPSFDIREDCLPEWVYYFFKINNRYIELEKIARGMGSKRIHPEQLADIEIPLPSIDDQRLYISKFKIIENSTDTVNNELSNQLDLLKKLRLQILQDAVQGKLVAQDPNDEPASVLLERIKAEKEKLVREKKIKKEKPLPPIKPEEIPFEIPENWVWCRLGEAATIFGGFTLGRSFKGELNTIPYLRVANVQRGYIDISHLKYLKLPQNEIVKYLLNINDILVNEGGDFDKVGRCAVWNGQIAECIHQNHLFRISSNFLNPIWLQHVINSDTSREYFLGAYKKSTNLASINRTKLTLLPIPIPPILEQNRMVISTNKILKVCDELEQTIQQNQKYTKELLQVALKEALEPKIN